MARVRGRACAAEVRRPVDWRIGIRLGMTRCARDSLRLAWARASRAGGLRPSDACQPHDDPECDPGTPEMPACILASAKGICQGPSCPEPGEDRSRHVLGQPPSIPSCCPRAWWSATKLRTAMCIVGPCDFPGATCPRQLLLSELQGVGISQRPPRLPGAGHGRGRAHGTGLRVLSARNACVWPAKTHMCTVFSVCACASACAVLWHVPGTAALIYAFFAAKTAKKHFATCW